MLTSAGDKWTKICGWVQKAAGEVQTEARHQVSILFSSRIGSCICISFVFVFSCTCFLYLYLFTRVALDMTTLTIMRYLPREVDPLVYNMSHEDPGDVTYSEIGGLGEQIRELREVIELPLLNPELFMRVGITPPKGFQILPLSLSSLN